MEYYYLKSKLSLTFLIWGILLTASITLTSCATLSPHPDQEATFYFDLGITYSMEEQWDKAISNLKKTTQINPAHAVAYHLLGMAYDKKTQCGKKR